ncbi:ATP-grasp domain-containing protein [Nocardioides panacisoli]|uniref:acetyl/propionyl/methylcrotonyl-CoA carboxylase subunit alpha n=1 Tax=Nocardioides panacisoli TaxID=627624 RepID=UPI001C63348F|nr:biotin carboxylase N-terminal domain-containing protein [Nocardioides panacisoli]QYJ03461.1 ATP-grasp domain-containing protein [Nocardioides panacisoli]
MTPIHSVLVANRGEIALRVFRTCRDLGMATVAIHTATDADAPHVRDADTAVEVPSYLDVDAIVAAAREAGADAVHPGFGFLSERAEFAAAVLAADLVWVGPSAEVIDRMGRKDAAREVAIAAGVPVVPSYAAEDDPASFAYPVLAKAASGGGGKGMRVVRAAEEYDDAVAAAKREALGAFGDDTMLVEKYVERGRHIEVQVMADAHGTVLHLAERDCSTQRRHQKVIEEAPAPTLTEAQRELVTSSAVALAAQVGYVGAGTVEFLLDSDHAGEGEGIYFLEMNTRLQVEHPVTEEVTGLDLVALQLRIAAGQPVGVDQADVTVRGHAIEVRIYAEDPYAGFLPQAGTASLVHWPAGARVDHALESGQVVSTSYDPMLGKVIVHGPDREAARLALVRALDDTAILGLTTNTGFLRELAAGPEFRDATIDTAWLDRNELTAPDPARARELAAWAWQRHHGGAEGPFAADGFRMGAAPAPIVVELDEPVTLGRPPRERPVALVDAHGVELAHRGQRYAFVRPDVAAEDAAAGDGSVVAPMPGTILAVEVAEGDHVTAGQRLGTMEAMKMELSLDAPYDGTVAAVGAAVGDQVALGAALFEVAAE